MTLPSHLIKFAAGDNDTVELFNSFKDYWNQYRSENSNGTKHFAFVPGVTLEQKGKDLNEAMIREIGKRAGVDFTTAPITSFANHPVVTWAAGMLASMMIEAILPDTIIESTAAYAEVRQLALGESEVFDISSRDLFPVSKAGRLGMRTAEVHKGFEGQVTLNPEFRQMTVGVSLLRVLTGLESLAKFTVKALRSLETAMTQDIYDTFNTAMSALTVNATTGLRVTGYTQADLVKLSQRVSAFSGGAAPIVLGTKVALLSVFPDDANYRYDIESEYVKLGYMRTIAGINTLELPQVANWQNPFATYLADDRLFIVAPGTDKLVKVVLGGDMISNVSGVYDQATLTQDATLIKGWKTGVVTSSVAAIITL
jgi:hypothetical protein